MLDLSVNDNTVKLLKDNVTSHSWGRLSCTRIDETLTIKGN